FAGLVVLVIVGAGGWLFFGYSISERSSRQQFDPVAWRADTHSFTNAVRIRMVDDLLRRHSFRGMTRDQITGIIGEPDKTEYFRDWDMVYWLGPERGFTSIDSEWLVFRLDLQKKVTDYRIVRD
ncbi:MAG: hypothetical protein M1541_18375, partial [Acidobacteria bacterium]|nr:hypothetical protein [Acidobacteriota bacterium]